MKYTTVTSPKWANAGMTLLDCSVNFDNHGTLPFSASADDVEVHGREIFNRAIAGDFGPIAAYTAPPPPPPPSKVSRAQARKALVLAGLYDSVQPAIDAIADPIQRKLVQIDWDDSLSFERNNVTLQTLATTLGLTSTQLDELFIQAAGL